MPILKEKQKTTEIKVTKTKIHEDGLPLNPTFQTNDPQTLINILVAPPGFGKTEFMASNPECIMLCCEEGHKFVKGFKVIIDCWDFKGKAEAPWTDQSGTLHMSFLQAVDLLESSERFKFVAVDTVDSLVKMILDFFYGKHKVDHASEIGDFGKGWDIAQNTPFRRAITRIVKTGRGMGLITHEEVVNRNFAQGTKAKKETTLPNGVWKFLYGQADIILHGVFGKRDKVTKKRQRLIVSEGSEDILAKNRGGKIPPTYICLEGKQWEQFSGFFTNPSSVKAEYAKYCKIYEGAE